MSVAKSPTDLMPLAEVAQISGLDFMTGILEGHLPARRLAKHLAIT